MARQVIRGTPITHRGPEEHGGDGKPAGYEGTVGEQYGRDTIDTRKGGGTPYHSERGNPPNASRVVSHGKYGEVTGLAGIDRNKPEGEGVMLDDGSHSYAEGFETTEREQTMDSPVPEHAPRFEPGFIPKADGARLGSGNERGREGLVAGGGVMSRRMEGTSKSGEAETSEDEADSGAPG